MDNEQTTTPHRRSLGPGLARAARRTLGPLALVALFIGVLASASLPASGPQLIDYREECKGEGCDGEEKDELWSSFQSECMGEACYTEEVAELAGTSIFGDGAYSDPAIVRELMSYFQTRTNANLMDVKVSPGDTEDHDPFYQLLITLLDSIEVSVTCKEAQDWNCDIGGSVG